MAAAVPENHRVLSVEPEGVAMVYDLSIANGPQNFVAEGVVVHNCNAFEYGLIGLYLGAPPAGNERRQAERQRHRHLVESATSTAVF